MTKRIAFLFLFTILLMSSSLAQTVIGKYAGEFLSIGVGGRALGMGGAYSAVANDVVGSYYNPASLARMNYPQIALMHDERFGNLVNYNYGAVAIPYGKEYSFGLSLMRLGVDGIFDTRGALYDANGDGVLDINKNDRLDYSKIKEFSNQDWAIYLTAAKRWSDELYFGVNLKVIKRDIAEFSATGIGFDLGVLYIPYKDLYLSANIQDITTTLVAWSTGRNELISPTAKIGGAYLFEVPGGVLTPAVDLDIRFENRRYASQFNIGPVSFDGHFGVEYAFKNLVAVRLGYSDVKQFTVGAGIKLPKLNIDYSFARFSASEDVRLPDSHRISIMLTLEEPKFLRAN